MRALVLSTLMLALCAPGASSQFFSVPRVEIRPSVGVRFPTGPQRDLFSVAPSIGGQGAIEMTPHMHMIGSIAWSPGRSKMNVADQGVDVLAYDLGVEYNLMIGLSERWDLKPFLGAGAGARTYLYDAQELSSATPLAAYASLGTELQRGNSAFRIESRGYLHGFENPITDEWDARRELGIAIGYAYHMPRP